MSNTNLILFFSFLVTFLISCGTSNDVITPSNPNQTQVNNNNSPIPMSNVKLFTYEVLDENGDTVHVGDNTDFIYRMKYVYEQSNSSNAYGFMRSSKGVSQGIPIAIAVSYDLNTLPVSKTTSKVIGTYDFLNELDIRVDIYDPSGDTWVTRPDQFDLESNNVVKLEDIGEYVIENFRIAQELQQFEQQGITLNDTVTVCRISGLFTKEFYKKDSPNNHSKIFTVKYDNFPLFITDETLSVN